MIEAAIPLLETRGLEGMSFTDVLLASGAARGAIYHHFPGGKTQLARAAATQNGEQIRGYLSALDGDTPLSIANAFFEGIRDAIRASAAGSGCAIAAISVHAKVTAEEQASLLNTANDALSSWIEELSRKFGQTGMNETDAQNLATLLIVTLEGAHPLCRAAGSTAPFEAAAAALRNLIDQTPN
ncbi:TetR/AcrR family transcriptional regulator [Klugiella xanthotipulae]